MDAHTIQTGITTAAFEEDSATNKEILATSVASFLDWSVEVTVSAVSSYTATALRSSSRSRSLATDGIKVTYDIYVPNALQMGYSTAEAAYDAIDSALTTAFNNNKLYDKILTEAADRGSDAFSTASLAETFTDEPTYPTISPTNEPGSTNSDGSSTGGGGAAGTVMIIAGVAFGICLVVACAYQGMIMVKGSSPAMATQEQDAVRPSTVPVTSNPMAATGTYEMAAPASAPTAPPPPSPSPGYF
jgi:F0F1-type ATP synthase membrane subunit c/vacuolar-type H+-ATPase subunit K